MSRLTLPKRLTVGRSKTLLTPETMKIRPRTMRPSSNRPTAMPDRALRIGISLAICRYDSTIYLQRFISFAMRAWSRKCFTSSWLRSTS